MKKNDFILKFVCIVGLCSCIFLGCRSNKEVVEETNSQTVVEFSADSTFTAAATTEKTTETHADSTNIHANEYGKVEIQRDSAGRPTFIIWYHDWSLQGNNKLQSETDTWFSGLKLEQNSKTSGKSGTEIKKKKEEHTEVNTSAPLDFVVGCVIVVSVLALYLLDYTASWIKRRKQ